jgi:UDP-N-acetylglucosamine 4-epimerase
MKYNFPANKTWLITGVAGFIGSNLLETLLLNRQRVVGIDNFLTGSKKNLDSVRREVGSLWDLFEFIEADIVSENLFEPLIPKVDFILHQAALGSVPRSIANPKATHKNNVEGFLNLLNSLRDFPEKKLVFASSSSVYGNNLDLPKIEDIVGEPQSPYAISKLMNEVYAKNFRKLYGLSSIGLRYFNVFGPRQNPNGDYAAVIPKWILALLQNQKVVIYGDGQTSRDFCFVDNVVQANILAALCAKPEAQGQIFNVAFGSKTSLNQLYNLMKESLVPTFPSLANHKPVYQNFRQGDIAHSLANIEKSFRILGYLPEYDIQKGLQKTFDSFMREIR